MGMIFFVLTSKKLYLIKHANLNKFFEFEIFEKYSLSKEYMDVNNMKE